MGIALPDLFPEERRKDKTLCHMTFTLSPWLSAGSIMLGGRF